ncbi:MAG: nuclear transport factor 2 family protein [Acidobacteriota bacterium]|jgi:hypothetical protein
MRMLAFLLVFSVLLAGFAAGAAPSQEDAIKATALDYIEGWYTGDAARMERALHPDLAKRIVMTGPDGHATVQNMTAEQLVDATRAGAGTRTPEDQRRMDVDVLDVYENVASVRVTATDWVDYLHIGRVDGEWKIINVLWELTPEAKARMGR